MNLIILITILFVLLGFIYIIFKQTIRENKYYDWIAEDNAKYFQDIEDSSVIYKKDIYEQ